VPIGWRGREYCEIAEQKEEEEKRKRKGSRTRANKEMARRKSNPVSGSQVKVIKSRDASAQMKEV